jgi:glycerol-3-phosphate O-acyltransferase
VLDSRPDGIAICDTNLLFYYQNRLAAHGVAWDVIAPPGVPSGLQVQPPLPPLEPASSPPPLEEPRGSTSSASSSSSGAGEADVHVGSMNGAGGGQ